MFSRSELLAALKRYWGHSEFRPKQEEIIRTLLEGRDACVVMPTGGGKSLCYQLPAALWSDRTVVVISPLIALMQDQVAELEEAGISAAFLNSTLGQNAQKKIIDRAKQGEYRLLYLSPERLAREDSRAWLRQVPVALFAIDEAHCISEWGHEFRPEYRQLTELRTRFPQATIAAFTASATQHVRHDIVEQLRLKDPAKFIASFHRPNLRYVVEESTGENQQELLLAALRHFRGESVIVYAPTIRRVEEVAAFLERMQAPCVAYHGKMTAKVRARNQELWMSDERTLLVGTLAFGLGINKPGVRAVIHLALPKSIEQFYQEAGRAGRDGKPSDCVLLWQRQDAGLQAYFARQISDEKEQQRAWDRFHQIERFVQSRSCRHRQICGHFGETTKWTSCGACDACGYRPAWWVEAKKSETVPRRRKRKTAAPQTAARRVAPAVARPAHPPMPAAREAKPANVLAEGKPWWGSARREQRELIGDAGVGLRSHLKEWRRKAAEEGKVPAFVVMHDTTLDALCSARPRTMEELLEVHGIGARKAERYGEQILGLIREFSGRAGE
jgi:ATP-dependent DNA helicase RecQ